MLGAEGAEGAEGAVGAEGAEGAVGAVGAGAKGAFPSHHLQNALDNRHKIFSLALGASIIGSPSKNFVVPSILL